jgi:hypothetical protein
MKTDVQTILHKERTRAIAERLEVCFDWENTEEGLAFWNDIQIRLYRISNTKNIEEE